MTLINLDKTPFPYFGGKADAAPLVWEALGDVAHYVEPFMGSLAVLLRRPHPANRTYHSETVNDLDGLLVNFWRSLQADPDAVAEAASWPVSEADMHARHLRLVAWRASGELERLMADPDRYDARMAGWWAWGVSCWIGSGWCSGRGAWVVGDDGRIEKVSKSGVGVKRQRPHLGNNGVGVNHAGTREAGVGVARQFPHIGSDGQGVNHAGTREAGVGDYHPMTMPELRRWLQYLSARLRHVRILHGDWRRATTMGAVRNLAVRMKGETAGVFFDPPYLVTNNREADLYTHDDGDNVAAAVREWCLAHTDVRDVRIVLAGFDGEHDELVAAGWRAVEWYSKGFLKGGMANTAGVGGTNQHKERLFLSPSCQAAAQPRQGTLFGGR